MKTVCFTGHRDVKITPELKDRLMDTLEKLIEMGCTDFYAGGATGWDMLCEAAVLALRKKYTGIKLHLILPCVCSEQTKMWRDEQKLLQALIRVFADSEEYAAQHYCNGCMKLRNERLVSYADCCVCYYNKKSPCGTGQTVRMAINRGIEIFNMAEQPQTFTVQPVQP